MRSSHGEEFCTVHATGERDAQGRPEEAGNAEREAFGGEADTEGCKRRSKVYVRSRWRWLSALVIAFALCALVPSGAFAASEQVIISDGMVFYQNSDRIDRGFMVMAYNRFNAGAMICGYDPSSFTEEQKTKLTQYVSGNNFYQLCETLQTVNENGVPSWASTQFNLFGSIWDLNSDFNGMEAFYGGFSDNELNLAKQDIQKVLNGEELQPPSGGGSGEQPTGIPTEFTMHPVYYDRNVNDVQYNSQFTMSASLSEATVNALSAYLGDYPYFFAYTQPYRITSSYTPSSRRTTLVVGLSKEPYVFNGVGVAMNVENVYVYGTVDYVRDGYDYKEENFNVTRISRADAITINVTDGSGNVLYLYSGSGSGEPTVPPSNWPENPTVVTPSPPELPEPRDPVIPNPPSDPVPTDPPTYITQPTYNVSVFTADLQGILDAMDEHCIHLQNALYTDLNALYNKLASTITEDNQKTRTLISNRFTWLGNVISECLDTLNDNLYDYFHWLAEQFDFESSGGYNDSTVVAWLKKIYAKLGGGSPVNPKPVDPVSDPFDFGKWLTDLWNTFIADLIAIGAEGLASIADDLQQLIHKFPFSIPWDIAAMLALLAAVPQTPVIQWPMFTYNGSVQVIQTTIDLTPYNNYVEPVRVMIKIGFAAVLAWRTKDMMELLTMARGGNNA